MSKGPTSNIRYLISLPGSSDDTSHSPEEQGAVDRINQRIAGLASLDEAMTFLSEAMQPLLPCDRISLAFLDGDSERLEARWVHTTYEPVLLGKGYSQGYSKGSLERIMEGGTPRIMDDLAAYVEEHPGSASGELLVKEGVRSSLTCPLKVDGRTVGMVFVCSRQPSAFSEHHVSLMESIVERLSQAVEKVHRLEQYEAANKSYLEVLGFVGHEVKNRLMTILLLSQMLRDERYGELNPDQLKRMDVVLEDGRSLMNLVRDYLDLSRLESGSLNLRIVPDVDIVAKVVRESVEAYRDALAEKRMVLEDDLPEDPVLIACDVELLKSVVMNFIGNAAKYGKSGGTVRVRVEAPEDKLVVSVWNEGPGFREADKGALFRKFSRLPTPEHGDIDGTGVGLYTSWRIVGLHKGRIHANSEYGKWAEFVFEIPRMPAPARPPDWMSGKPRGQADGCRGTPSL